MKTIIKFIFVIFLINNYVSANTTLDITAKDIANISSTPLYNYDGASLEKIIDQYIQQNDALQAIIVVDKVNHTIFYSVFKQNGKLIRNKKIPDSYKNLIIAKSDISHNSNVIGEIILYASQKIIEDKKTIHFTDKEKQWIKEHPVIRFISDAMWPPFEFIDKNGKYAGISSSYINILARKTGIHFKRVKIDSWADGIEKIKNNKADMLACVKKTVSRTKFLNFSKPYLNYSIVMVTTLDKPFLDNIKALYGKKVVAIKGYAITEFLSNYPQIELLYVNNVREALEAVSSKKAYAFVSVLPVASYNINKYNFFNLKIAGKIKNDFPLTIALRKELGQTGIDIINKVLNTISEQEKEVIYNQWVSVTFNKRVDYTIIWQILFVSFMLISIVLYWNRKLKAQQLELKKMTQKAQIATKAKSEFLSNMSHEIRTPLNAILGFTEILSKEIKDAGQLSYIKTIQHSGNALLMLINDILDLSKIEAGKLEIQKTPADIASIIEEIKTIFSIEAKKKGIEIIIDIQKDLPNSLVIDTVRVRQILLNLVGNSIKFTKKGYIKISVFTEKLKNNKVNLIINVEDTGKGIPQDQLSLIFDAFEQVKGQDIKQFGGTGLGLSISSKLAKMMGGQLSVKSEEGKGSIFTLKLCNVEISSQPPQLLNTYSNNSIIFDKATILAVDDIDTNLQLIISNFKDTNITVITAKNGKEAIEKFKQYKPDLILMNLKMPVMNGYEAAKEIKKISNIPIIALTASLIHNNLEIFDGYLKKPFTTKDLFTTLSQFLPHHTIKEEEKKEDEFKFTLNPKAKENIKDLAKMLDVSTIPIYKKIHKSNNISDIKNFIKNLKNLYNKYQIESLKIYIQELQNALKTFDIIKIETLLSDFKKFIDLVKNYTP